MSFSVNGHNSSNSNALLLDQHYPALEAFPMRIGWGPMDAHFKSGAFADLRWRFYVNQQAGMQVIGPGANVMIAAKQLVILPAWLTWRLHCTQALEHLYVEVECPSLGAAQIAKHYHGAITARTKSSDAFISCVRKIQQAQAHKEHHQTQAQSSGLGNLLQAAIHQVMADIAPDFIDAEHRPQLLQDLIAFIQEHLADDLRVPSLAHTFHCSPKHLTNLFNQFLSVSPAAFIREQRIARACHLLRESERSIEQIAEDVGFANRAYLSRVMQAMTHVPPARYRKRHQQ